jgi:hypothetical protein
MAIDRMRLREIEEEAEKKVQDDLSKAKAKIAGKKGRKGSGGKTDGREVILTDNGMNCFNARTAAASLTKQLKGSILHATIDIDGVVITMERMPKRKDNEVLRYLVKGGLESKDVFFPKKEAVLCLSERAVLVRRQANKGKDLANLSTVLSNL